MEKCRYKSLEELPAIMCADDVKDVLGISISSTYELMKEKDFPSFKIGRRVVIYKEKFIEWVEKKSEKKNPPLLYNLAELQNECAKLFKINPDETLRIAQELYEKKLTTYPRTDARVLSTAVAKEIYKNLRADASVWSQL